MLCVSFEMSLLREFIDSSLCVSLFSRSLIPSHLASWAANGQHQTLHLRCYSGRERIGCPKPLSLLLFVWSFLGYSTIIAQQKELATSTDGAVRDNEGRSTAHASARAWPRASRVPPVMPLDDGRRPVHAERYPVRP